MEKIKNIVVILGLIGGLMSMGTAIGVFAQVVRHWDQFVYMSEVVNKDSVDQYYKVVIPQHNTLWQERHHP
jgi:hypothetical protein